MNQSEYEACVLLKININGFLRIKSISDKKVELLRCYLKQEFNVVSQNEFPKIDKFSDLKALKKAYLLLLNSPLILMHTSPFSPFSQGLFDLYSSSLDDHELIPIREKQIGIEPGFEAVRVSDILMTMYQFFPKQSERLSFIINLKTNIMILYEVFKAKLPVYLIKLDYHNWSLSNHYISPRLSDIMRTNTIHKIYQYSKPAAYLASFGGQLLKTVSIQKKNLEAVHEVLANDIARIYGMHVQEQKILISHYQNGILKLMLKAKFIQQAASLQPLAGSNNYHNYCIKPVLLPKLGICYLSDQRIKELAEYYALFVWLADPDAIGSQGQNKLYVNHQMIGIDFGHTFLKNQYQHSPNILHNSALAFKNYTIFSDFTRSEKLQGFFRLARLANKYLKPSILQSYGKNFTRKIFAIIPFSDELIFDDYLHAFNEDYDKVGKCTHIIAGLAALKHYAIKERMLLIQDVNMYLTLPKMVIDLMENIEKLIAGPKQTSLRSIDKTVLLNHLNLQNSDTVQWDILYHADNAINLALRFKKQKPAEEAFSIIAHWVTQGEKRAASFTLCFKMTFLELSFSLDELHLLDEIFAEKTIIAAFHPADFLLYQYYQCENKLLTLRQAWLKWQVEINITVKAEINCYEITIQSENHKSNSLLTDLKQAGFKQESGKFFITSQKLNSFVHHLESNLFCFQSIHQFNHFKRPASPFQKDLNDNMNTNLLKVDKTKPSKTC